MWDDQFEELIRGYLPFLSPSEPLEADADLRDLGLDSLATVDVLGRVEEAFGVRFVDEALSLDTFSTPEKLWGTISSLRAAAAIG
jgi:acyl carrier protein